MPAPRGRIDCRAAGPQSHHQHGVINLAAGVAQRDQAELRIGEAERPQREEFGDGVILALAAHAHEFKWRLPMRRIAFPLYGQFRRAILPPLTFEEAAMSPRPPPSLLGDHPIPLGDEAPPQADAPVAAGEALTLALDDLIPDARGEIVILDQSGHDIAVVSHEAVAAQGLEPAHFM